MVLEELISSRKASEKPILIFFIAFIIATISIWLSYHVFPSNSSVLPLAFLTTAFAPLLHKLYIKEAIHEVEAPGFAPSFITRHFPLVWFYLFMFLGVMTCYAFWFAVLPADPIACGPNCFLPTKDKVFAEQQNVFTAITGQSITGKAIGEIECKNPDTRSIEACFGLIFFNNFWVLNLAIIISFLYGTGAIFLIGWNASVIGTFIGLEILEKNVFAGLDRFLGYFPHGSLEVMAYFFGAVAGGVVSVAMIADKHKKHALEIIAKDALILVLIANGLLALGAIIEAIAIVNTELANSILTLEVVLLIIVAIILFLRQGRNTD